MGSSSRQDGNGIVKKESGVPTVIKNEHIGMKVLYRLSNNKMALEGIIKELSPGGEYINVGRNWIESNGLGILAVLSGPQRRREAIR